MKIKTKKQSNFKFKKIVWLIFALLIFILLILGFKIINEIINGTENWLKTVKATNLIDNKYIVDSWFTGSKGISHFLQGPIGFESFLQFKLIGKLSTEEYNIFLLPIFLDLLINWIFILGMLIIILLIIIYTIKYFVYSSNKNKFKVIEETKTGTDLIWKNKNGEILTRNEVLKKTKEELKELNLQKIKGKNGYYVRSIPDKKKKNNLDNK